MTSIFLSYARSDDEPFVRRLYDDLTKLQDDEGRPRFDVWFDREHMPNRGLTFLREIQDAITARDRLVLVVGPGAVASDYVRAEWRWALEIGKPINPVLRLGDYDLLPAELKVLDAPDFRADADYSQRLKTLVRQISEPIAPMGRLVAVPDLPQHFLRQPDRLRALRDALLADLSRPVVMSGTAGRAGVQGMPGIGKSVLAAAFARDLEVRRAFPDGVFWVPLGQRNDVVALQRDLARALDDPGDFENEQQGKARLSVLLADKSALLILDDAWDIAQVRAFEVLGPRGRLLLTTRDAALAQAVGGTHYPVQLLTEEESLALLSQWSGQPLDSLPLAAHAVMAHCGRLALALSICGAMAAGGTSWSDLFAALRAADLEFLDHPLGNVLRSIKVSIEALTPAERERFAELAVFPSAETVPEAAVVTLWTHTGSQPEYKARQLLTKLERRALLHLDAEAPRPGVEPMRHVSLHNLLHDYATHVAGDQHSLHGKLLAAYRAKCPESWWKGPNDGYFFTHLRDHLSAAGRGGELADLLHELRWLEAKNAAGLVFDLPADFHEALASLPEPDSRRRTLELLDEALRRDILFIHCHREYYPQGLFQCLWNHGWWFDCPEAPQYYVDGKSPSGSGNKDLHILLERWRANRDRAPTESCWMRSLRPPPLHLEGGQCCILRGHENRVRSVAWSPDGAWIVSGSSDYSLRIWNARTGEEIRVLRGHEDPVSSVAWSPDGAWIASGSGDRTVRIWDAVTGVQLQVLRGHKNPVFSVSWSPNGTQIASGSGDCTVLIWNIRSGRAVHALRGHTDRVRSVMWSPSGRQIASASSDRTICIWDSRFGTKVQTLRGHENSVESVAWAPDGAHIVSGSSDRKVRIWEASSGTELSVLNGHFGTVLCVAWSPDGTRIASASADKTVRIWDTRTGVELHVQHGHEYSVTSVTWASAETRIASGSDDCTVRIWDAGFTRESHMLKGHERLVSSVAWSPDGTLIGTGSFDDTVRIWKSANGAQVHVLFGHRGSVLCIAWSPDGTRIASASGDKTVRVWDPRKGCELHVLFGHEGSVSCVAWSPDGKWIASGSNDGNVRIWDATTMSELQTICGELGELISIEWSSDGKQILGQFSHPRFVYEQVRAIWFVDAAQHVFEGGEPSDIRAPFGEGDTGKGEQLSNVPTSCEDFKTIARGVELFQVAHCSECMVISKSTMYRFSPEKVVALFPESLNSIATHPYGRLWAGVSGNHLYLLQLEGDPPP